MRWTDKGCRYGRTILDTGEVHLYLSPVRRVYARHARKGTYRWYIQFAPLCGTLTEVRIAAADKQQGLQARRVSASVTKTTEGSSLYDRCFGWREDSESTNNALDRTLASMCQPDQPTGIMRHGDGFGGR